MLPPAQGWPTGPSDAINDTELRNRGKSEQVIDTLRHLPYLDQELYGPEWTLADNTLHINYARGQMYPDFLERDQGILPLPGHIIWLTEGFERAGVYLLLNVETWEIIEYTLLGESIEIDKEAYEALEPDQRWMAYSAMPADRYFDLWRWRHLTLQFILVRDPRVFRGTAEWFFKDPRLLYEESFVPDEDEDGDDDEDFVPDSDSDSDSESDSESSDSESVDGEDDPETLEEEIHLLSLDEPSPSSIPTASTPKRNRKSRSFLHTHAQPLNPNSHPSSLYQSPWFVAQRNDTLAIINIYISHGWPLPTYEWRVSGLYLSPPPPPPPPSSSSPPPLPPLSSGSDPSCSPEGLDLAKYIDSLDLSKFRRNECLEALSQWIQARHERQRVEAQMAQQNQRISHKRERKEK